MGVLRLYCPDHGKGPREGPLVSEGRATSQIKSLARRSSSFEVFGAALVAATDL
jgi:hypothetical protein